MFVNTKTSIFCAQLSYEMFSPALYQGKKAIVCETLKAMAPCVNMIPQAKLYVLTNVSEIARPGIKSALYQSQRTQIHSPKAEIMEFKVRIKLPC
jgi:hypothetical protein